MTTGAEEWSAPEDCAGRSGRHGDAQGRVAAAVKLEAWLVECDDHAETWENIHSLPDRKTAGTKALRPPGAKLRAHGEATLVYS